MISFGILSTSGGQQRPGPLPFRLVVVVVLGLVVALSATCCSADVIISEISDKGSSTVCSGGNDWLELHNTPSPTTDVVSVDQTDDNDDSSSEVVDLSGYILHDDNGLESNNIFTFPAGQELLPGEYLVLCTKGDDESSLTSPQFKIGSGDTLTLLNTDNQVISSVALPDGVESGFDVTYAWNSIDNTYSYTSTPTPGAANVFTAVEQETVEQIKQRLSFQNALGTQFFGMDDNGLPVVEDSMSMGEVVDLHLTMEQPDYDYLMQNASYQLYSPFTSARVVRNNTDGTEEELLYLDSPGRLRGKGQSTLVLSNCLGTETMPFLVEFNTINKTQTLFGVERLYLRMHYSDNSFMREWSAHRMLARFGLPHLRARTMRLFINGNRMGFYTALEAVEQEYVFHRSFPNYTPESYALYKFKTLANGCGKFDPDRLQAAQARMDDAATPPYFFERGDHREPTIVRGPENRLDCFTDMFENIFDVEFRDVELAYLRANEDCGKMLVEEGLVDLDLGSRDYDSKMQQFVNQHLADNTCDDGCRNSNLSDEVDIENFLKHFAFYAVSLTTDSPMGIGNNYYLVETGEGNGWKMVSYDHNTARSVCGDCDEHFPYWSILRPTCGALEDNQIVGPLLSNATLHAQYVEYVRAFTNEVLGNASFVEEMTHHVQAIEEYVKEDFWSDGGQFFEAELSPDAADWNSTYGLPALPLYKARVESVREQLAAYDRGEFPRGPHLEKDVARFEECVDWRSQDVPETSCPENCFYEGCHIDTSYIAGSSCDANNSICYQYEYDVQCAGVADGERYSGMKNRPDGRETFCTGAAPFFLKSSQCPPFLAGNDTTATTTDGDSDEPMATPSGDRNGVAASSWSPGQLSPTGSSFLMLVATLTLSGLFLY